MIMDEYIEREALEVALNHRLNFLMAENGEYDHYTSGFDEAVTRVENFPAADVAPVVHAKWDANGRCTNCGGHAPYYSMASTYHESPYCFECGARMDKDEV